MSKLVLHYEASEPETNDVIETTITANGDRAEDIYALLKEFKRFTVALGYSRDLWTYTLHGEYMPPSEMQLQLQQA